jgi:hypothetical protein
MILTRALSFGLQKKEQYPSKKQYSILPHIFEDKRIFMPKK